MTHEVIRHLLDDYVTGDLADDARAPVAEHLAGWRKKQTASFAETPAR